MRCCVVIKINYAKETSNLKKAQICSPGIVSSPSYSINYTMAHYTQEAVGDWYHTICLIHEQIIVVSQFVLMNNIVNITS